MLVTVTFTLAVLGIVGGATSPNIIIIVADDLGWDDVSFHGSDQIPTPNLDSLAYDGIQLSNYYVQPICTPTRSALMTGRHPVQLGLQHGVILAARPYGLGLNETIFPQYLKKVGYDTHIVGKWHLGFFEKEYTPTYRGFDSYFGYYLGKEGYFDHTSDMKDPDTWGLDFRRDTELVKDKFGQYSTEVFTQEAESVISRHDTSKPLFLYLPHQAVHSGNSKDPLEAPWSYIQRFSHIQNKKRRTFAAMVSALDDSVGNITKALHDKGMLNNSIIVFTTDNGGPAAGFDMNMACNWPLRGVKATLWEGGVRGAGFVWSPLLQNSGHVSHQLLHVTDWLPTLLHAAGYDTSTLPKHLYGVDQWQALSQKGPSQRKEILHNFDTVDNYRAIRYGDMKLIAGEYPGGRHWDSWFPPPSIDNQPSPLESQRSSSIDNPPTAADHQPSPLENQGQQIEKPQYSYSFTSVVKPILASLGRGGNNPGKPLLVNCGTKPANASTNCALKHGPCLFNVTADPCEFRNLAHDMPGYVDMLLHKLKRFGDNAAPVKNVPTDPLSYPSLHGWAWGPWRNKTGVY